MDKNTIGKIHLVKRDARKPLKNKDLTDTVKFGQYHATTFASDIVHILALDTKLGNLGYLKPGTLEYTHKYNTLIEKCEKMDFDISFVLQDCATIGSSKPAEIVFSETIKFSEIEDFVVSDKSLNMRKQIAHCRTWMDLTVNIHIESEKRLCAEYRFKAVETPILGFVHVSWICLDPVPQVKSDINIESCV